MGRFRSLWLISLLVFVVGLITNCGGSAPLLDQPNNPSVTTTGQSTASPTVATPSQSLEVGSTTDAPATDADVGINAPSSPDTVDRSVSSEYIYMGNFSGTFYLPGWWVGSPFPSHTVYWNATNGVGTKKLSYMQSSVGGAGIDLYYRDKSSYWAWVWFDRLTPTPWWRYRNIYVGSGTVMFKFVISNGSCYSRTVYLRMVQ
jgi:hypothetical protein